MLHLYGNACPSVSKDIFSTLDTSAPVALARPWLGTPSPLTGLLESSQPAASTGLRALEMVVSPSASKKHSADITAECVSQQNKKQKKQCEYAKEAGSMCCSGRPCPLFDFNQATSTFTRGKNFCNACKGNVGPDFQLCTACQHWHNKSFFDKLKTTCILCVVKISKMEKPTVKLYAKVKEATLAVYKERVDAGILPALPDDDRTVFVWA